jgi:hypothetical protein
MSKHRALILTASAGLVLVAGFIAWEYWPVALRYREARALKAERRIVRSYLDKQDSLRVAACQLAIQMRRRSELLERLSWVVAAESTRIVDVPLAPAGTDPGNPRLQELTFNAARYTLPSTLPAQVRSQIIRLNDSLMRARGFRIVECAA